MTNAERATELKAALDAVRTNAQARSAAAAAATSGAEAIGKLGGFIASGMREQIAMDVTRVTGAAEAIPEDDGVPGDAWTARPGGLRVAIESLTANVWSQEKNFPAGTSAADDFAIFADGFIQGIKDALGVLPQIPNALAPVLWPLGLMAVVVLVLVVVVKAKAGA